MPELNLTHNIKKVVEEFNGRLKNIYGYDLISVILYGSAASGEFSEKRSNIDMLVILKDASIRRINKARQIINKPQFRALNVMFFTEDYLRSSTDVFPIEFLDLRENYLVLHGKDVLEDLEIDTRNLRYQCEQGLKLKLINLKQLYLAISKDETALRNLLFKSFTSTLHILRNVLRLKGKTPPYLKSEVLKELSLEFKIDLNVWERILSGKNGSIKLNKRDLEALFISFVEDLEKIVNIVDIL